MDGCVSDQLYWLSDRLLWTTFTTLPLVWKMWSMTTVTGFLLQRYNEWEIDWFMFYTIIGIWFYWMMQLLFGLLYFLQKKPVVRSAPSGQGRTTRGRKTVPSLQVNKVRRTNFRRIFYPERSNPAAEPSGTASGPSSSVEPRKPRKRRPVRGTEKIAASLSEITLHYVCVYVWLAVWAWAWRCFRFHFVWLITICEPPHLPLIISWWCGIERGWLYSVSS